MNVLIDAAVTFEKLTPNDKAYVMGYMQACLNKKAINKMSSVALPETPPVEPAQAQEPAYRFILNVPEIKDYKDAK